MPILKRKGTEMIFKVMATGVLAIALPALALAGPQYSAEEIEKHFAAPQAGIAGDDCPVGSICLPKKKTRGVCIGSASKCGGSTVVSRPAPTGFDLLITFELGSDRLSRQAEQNLREFARAMSQGSLQQMTFNIDGHTDASGSDSYNMTLSQRRATSVVRYLEAAGIDASRLRAKGHGETAPRNSADPFAAINRRVEATVRVQ